jgi:hypothetical protein
MLQISEAITWGVRLYRYLYEGVSKSFRTGRLERELQMIQLCATRCSCIAILWVSLVNFAAITLYVASERLYFVIDSVRKLLVTPSYRVTSKTNMVTVRTAQHYSIWMSAKDVCWCGNACVIQCEQHSTIQYGCQQKTCADVAMLVWYCSEIARSAWE